MFNTQIKLTPKEIKWLSKVPHPGKLILINFNTGSVDLMSTIYHMLQSTSGPDMPDLDSSSITDKTMTWMTYCCGLNISFFPKSHTLKSNSQGDDISKMCLWRWNFQTLSTIGSRVHKSNRSVSQISGWGNQWTVSAVGNFQILV